MNSRRSFVASTLVRVPRGTRRKLLEGDEHGNQTGDQTDQTGALSAVRQTTSWRRPYKPLGKPTTESWWLAEAEGQMRAIAVLNLEVEGETPSTRAAEIGRIFQRIARDQMERPRSFEERDAIAHFLGLIGELAAAYTPSENLVCRRATAMLTKDTEARAESGKPRRRKKKRSPRR